ncbi:MAG: hypothetical protein KGO96_07685 [Elusimicrobia bacterium]|nr:hypothetical protein [Elusimicrobiota bacterium]
MKYNNIQQGQWCKKCNTINRSKNFLNKCHRLANIQEGHFLSKEYINNYVKYIWKCKYDHMWEATYGDVNKGTWCPYCVHRHSKPELEIFEFVKSIYPDALNGVRILQNKRFELDIYIPSLNKAIEFDGIIFHGETAIYNKEYITDRDLRKNQQCQESGIQLLRIKEQDYKENKELIFKKILDFLE